MNSRDECGRGGKRIGNLARDGVANAQLIFVDVGVVDAIDREPAQDVVAHEDVAFVMLETERFEKILVDDDGAGRNDGVHHVVADEIDHDVLEARREE